MPSRNSSKADDDTDTHGEWVTTLDAPPESAVQNSIDPVGQPEKGSDR